MQSILGNTRKADITFLRSGRICISSRVSRQLDLKHGDVIDILESYGEYYLYVKYHSPTVGRHEGMVFRSNRNGNHFICSSKRLCSFVFAQYNEYDKVRLCCGTPINLLHYGTVLPIIIKCIL